MAISLTGKLVILFVSLAVIGGMTAVIVLVVNDSVPKDDDIPSTTTAVPTVAPEGYQVGVGIADMTGPCVEITFMGYAELGQKGGGIHLRQFSRAFIFVQGNTRVVLVTAEVQAVGIAVRRGVVNKLQELYGNMYNIGNVIITGTHTHSAPGGHLVDFLLDVSIMGFSRETYDAYVEGITRSIVRAHSNIVPARMYFGSTQVKNAHVNRSPYSYDINPEEEKARYESNTDDELTQIRIIKMDGTLHGVMNWFSIHTTSMNMSNHLISSDNLGYAALKMEETLNPGRLAGKPLIVTGFFTSSLGDISPNTQSPKCEFSGNECDNQFKFCQLFERCFASGPGEDMFESTRIIGEKVYEGAMQILNSNGEEITSDISVIHQFVEMGSEVVPKYNPVTDEFMLNETVGGCVPAMGYSFASGTTDGANILNITQGTIEGNPLLDAVTGIVGRPTEQDARCHAPKPILLATGRANFPIPWHPHTISITLIQLGQVTILGVPGEPSTMAGRRMKRVVQRAKSLRGQSGPVIVSSLCNEYVHYITTFEEYQVQRYEAASTIYGPHTLNIFLHKFHEYTLAAIHGTPILPGIEPVDFKNRTLSLILPVVMDNAGVSSAFGDVIQHPPEIVTAGDIVRAEFVAANPRNDLRQELSYGVVERLEIGEWVTIATDADWDTKFTWERESTILGTSKVTIEWRSKPSVSIPHRIVYYGAAKSVFGDVTQFKVCSMAEPNATVCLLKWRKSRQVCDPNSRASSVK